MAYCFLCGVGLRPRALDIVIGPFILDLDLEIVNVMMIFLIFEYYQVVSSKETQRKLCLIFLNDPVNLPHNK